MGDTAVIEVKTEPVAKAQLEMISWADWWEQWGDVVFDDPNEFVDIEPVYVKK